MPPTVIVDRRRDVIAFLLLVSAGVVWCSFSESAAAIGNPRWFSLATAGAMLPVCFGIWRGYEWSRWAAGLWCVAQAAGLGIAFVEMLGNRTPAGNTVDLGVLGTPAALVLLFGAIAFYLLRPTTRRLFAHVRAVRREAAPAPS